MAPENKIVENCRLGEASGHYYVAGGIYRPDFIAVLAYRDAPLSR